MTKPRIADDFDDIRRSQEALFGRPKVGQPIPARTPIPNWDDVPRLNGKLPCYCRTSKAPTRMYCRRRAGEHDPEPLDDGFYCTGVLPEKEDGA